MYNFYRIGSLLSTIEMALEIDLLSPFRIPAIKSDTSDLLGN